MGDDTGNLPRTRAPLIAVVEDDYRFLESLDDLLQSSGYRTLLSPSAEDFLQSPQRPRVHALISDVRLPGLSGIELVRTMQQNAQDLPTILITGRSEVDLERDARDLRVLRLFTKPFDASELLDALDRQFAAGPP